jgi:hypothetical protein
MFFGAKFENIAVLSDCSALVLVCVFPPQLLVCSNVFHINLATTFAVTAPYLDLGASRSLWSSGPFAIWHGAPCSTIEHK